MPTPIRSALLVRCSREEADLIRHAAKRERRTVSAYILNAVLARVRYQQEAQQLWPKSLSKKADPGSNLPH